VPDAADQIAEAILSALGQGAGQPVVTDTSKKPGSEYNVKVVAS
jgi:hypothetical protein